MADTAGSSSALGEEPGGHAGEQRGAAAAGLDDGWRLDGAQAALGVEDGGVPGPAAGDDDLRVRTGDLVDVGDQRLHLARHGVDRAAPHGDRLGVGQPHRRAIERVQLELERGRVAGSGGEHARAELFAIGAELVEHLSQGKSGPHAGQQRLAPLGHVPADGHAGLRAAPARGGVLRRGDAHERLGGPARVEHVAGRDHADADAGDEVVVAGHGQHGALGAGQGDAVAAPGIGARDDELTRARRRAGPPTRARRRRARRARGRAGRCARRARARRPGGRRGGARSTRRRSASAPRPRCRGA